MAEIVSLVERMPHGSGEARCMDCGYRWVAIARTGQTSLDCPSCEGERGMWRHPFGPVKGDMAFSCNHCECEFMYALIRRGKTSIFCSGCGVDQTLSVWG